MGFSGALGSILGTILISYEATRYVFVVKGTIYLFGAIQTMFLTDELEINERASIKNQETIRYENMHREKLIASGYGPDEIERQLEPPFCSLLCMKLKLAYNGLCDPAFRNLSLLILFLGFTMPVFSTYDLYFHIDQ